MPVAPGPFRLSQYLTWDTTVSAGQDRLTVPVKGRATVPVNGRVTTATGSARYGIGMDTRLITVGGVAVAFPPAVTVGVAMADFPVR